MFKKIFSTLVLASVLSTGIVTASSVSTAADAAPVSAIAPSVATKIITQKVTKTSLNVRKSATTKSKILKTLKKNTVLSTTGKKSGKWIQIKVGKSTGWVHSSYVTTKKVTVKSGSASAASTKAHKATSAEQKAWTTGLPKACKAVPIKSIQIKNPSKKGWSVNASTKISGSKIYYTISVNGNLKPKTAPAYALMKHECGHVLMSIYSKNKGKPAFQKELTKGWASSNTKRVENAADCIADQLGAKRKGSGYTIGYGTKCSAKQKTVAKTFVNYSKNRTY